MKEERENLIQDNKIENNKKEKNEKQGRGLFYFVIAFAVIIIAIVGATYAYFSSQALTNENDVKAGSTEINLSIETDSSGANYDLIPTADAIAKYAYAEQEDPKEDDKCATYETDETGNPTSKCIAYKNTTCRDDSGAAVCSTYTFTVTNDNMSSQTLKMFLGTTDNGFNNLYFAVYTNVETVTETGTVSKRTRITKVQEVAKNDSKTKEIEFELRDDINDADKDKFENLVHPILTKDNPKRTYTIVLWIHETTSDQTSEDGKGKTFAGYVKVTSGEGNGVTGYIGKAGSDSETKEYDDSLKTTSTTTSTTTSEVTSEVTSEATSTPGE